MAGGGTRGACMCEFASAVANIPLSVGAEGRQGHGVWAPCPCMHEFI